MDLTINLLSTTVSSLTPILRELLRRSFWTSFRRSMKKPRDLPSSSLISPQWMQYLLLSTMTPGLFERRYTASLDGQWFPLIHGPIDITSISIKMFSEVLLPSSPRSSLKSHKHTPAMPHYLDYNQIVSKAVASDEVIDIFTAAGLKKPDISILSDEFLAEVRGLPQRNLAVEMLRKLLEGEIKTRGRKNIVQARSFSEMLEKSIRRYQNRAIETAQVIEELIALAKDLREADRRGEKLGLTEDEIAFYDALEVNDSAVKVLGDETLRGIAQELLYAVRNNVTIDWTVRENVRAKMRVMVSSNLVVHLE